MSAPQSEKLANLAATALCYECVLHANWMTGAKGCERIVIANHFQSLQPSHVSFKCRKTYGIHDYHSSSLEHFPFTVLQGSS